MQANSSEVKRTLQGESSLAERIRWVLARHGLQQQQLAEVMGVKHDRVKSLVLDRAKKLRAEEIDRLVAAYGLPRGWLVDGSEPAPAGFASRSGVPAERSPPLEEAHMQRETPLPRYAPSNSATDAQLLQQVVDATAAALTARGVQLPPERRLRLYWAVYSVSLPAGRVDTAAIPALIQLADETR